MLSIVRWLKNWPNVEEAWILPISIIASGGIILIAGVMW